MRVKSEWHIQKAKPYFSTKSASDAVVWAAFCGCTFEEGPAYAGGALEVQNTL